MVSMQCTNRREFLKTAGVAGLGLVALSGVAGSIISCATPNSLATGQPSSGQGEPAALPWPYKKLDPKAAAERAYAAYYNGGCMYGAFEGIIGELRDSVGAPYDTVPTAFSKYGGAGVSGWGTLCGALNGMAAATYFFLDSKSAGPIINDVYGWYGSTSLPDYKPVTPKFDTLPGSVANSQLCHASVTNWCNASGFKTTSPERAERCAWITASVVYKTVELANQQADGAFKQTFADPASVTGCLSCHGKGSTLENVHTSNATDCRVCHTTFPSAHPVQ
jgi:hypothetical protein